MLDFMKSKTFSIVASFILGFGLMALFSSACRGGDCATKKAPSSDEITKATYQVGSKCYQFHTEITDCGTNKVIESFQDSAARAPIKRA
jgi:hypothetical protein